MTWLRLRELSCSWWHRWLQVYTLSILGWAEVWGNVSGACFPTVLFVNRKGEGVFLVTNSHTAKCHSYGTPALTLENPSAAGLCWSYFQGPPVLSHSASRLPPCWAPGAWQAPQISLTTSRTDAHQMLSSPHILTWGWINPPLPNGNWQSLVLWLFPQGKRREEQWSDFGWLTDFELEVICLALDYLVFTIPVLITPISFPNPCITSKKNCKHVRLLFSANSLRDQCQTRLCLKTRWALTTRGGDRVTFLVNWQLDFHLGAWWILLLLLFWTEG